MRLTFPRLRRACPNGVMKTALNGASGWHEDIRSLPDARAFDAASRSAMTAGIGSPDEQVTLGASRRPAPAETCAKRERNSAKELGVPASTPHQVPGRPPPPRPMRAHQKRIGLTHRPNPAKSNLGTDSSGSHVRQIAGSARVIATPPTKVTACRSSNLSYAKGLNGEPGPRVEGQGLGIVGL
jgi:hypothetical protein